MKRPFELVAEIQDKDAEIAAMAKLAVLLKVDIAEKDAEIERLKALLVRAADALDYQLKFINEHCCDGYPSASGLITELRKAAE